MKFKALHCCLLFALLLLNDLPVHAIDYDWIRKTDFKGGKVEEASSFSIGKTGYICLGTDGLGTKKEVWQYTPAEDKWTKLAKFDGEGRTKAVSFTIGKSAYLGTGLIGMGETTQGSKDFWEFNSVTNTWTQKAEVPGGVRSAAIGFSIGDKGYIGLGSIPGGLKALNDIWEYDPQANKWTKKADLPDEGRSDASVFTIDGKAYILFGMAAKELSASKKSIWEFNPKKNNYLKKADFPGLPRSSSVAFSMIGKGYVYGGWKGSGSPMADFWEYNAATNAWKQLPDAPAGVRNGAVCFAIDSSLYVGTGHIKTFGIGNADFWCISFLPSKGNVDYNAKLIVENKNIKLPLAQQGVTLMNDEKKVLQTTKTDKNGAFAFKKLDVEGKYEVVIDKPDNVPGGATVAVAKPNGKIIQNLQKNENGQFSYEVSKLSVMEEDDSYFNLQYFMKSPDTELTVTANIYYPPGSAELTKDAQDLLYQVVVSMNQYPNLHLELSSHTDAVGSDQSNLELSDKRAKFAVDYLVHNGIDGKRLTGKGYGETKILNRCKNGVECSEEEHKINRRTEFKFIKKK